MKVRCIRDGMSFLTKGKVYEVIDKDYGVYAIVDNGCDGVYLYGKSCFEEIEKKYERLIIDDTAYKDWDPSMKPPPLTAEQKRKEEILFEKLDKIFHLMERSEEYYTNCNFKDVEYDDDSYCGIFEVWAFGVQCEFFYDRKTKNLETWNSCIPMDEVLPIPIWWLDCQIKKFGKLTNFENRTECMK